MSISFPLRPFAHVVAPPNTLRLHYKHPRHVAVRHPRHATVTALSGPDSTLLATGLSYLVGAGSLLLYTPIAFRTIRTGSAKGLTLSTWWLKLASYTASDVYSFSNAYPIAQYVETSIITLEAAAILLLVSWYQQRLDATFATLATGYVATTAWALAAAPSSVLAVAQGGSTLLNTIALLPQIAQNARRRSSGGYSPVTALLACAGCSIRIFTTYELAEGDPLLLAGFAAGLALNGAILAQVLYYGVVIEGRTVLAMLGSDFRDKGSSDEFEL